MTRTLTVIAAGAVVVLAALPGCGPAGPNNPFPHHTTLSAGTLRVTNRTQAVQDRFAAPFAVVAMQGPSGAAPQKWLNDLCSSVRNTREEYYEDSVALLSMIVVTGNDWDPTIAGA